MFHGNLLPNNTTFAISQSLSEAINETLDKASIQITLLLFLLKGEPMKVSISEYDDESYGVELVAENEKDKEILRRFWVGGVKVNSMTNDYKLQLTFKDLIVKSSEKVMPKVAPIHDGSLTIDGKTYNKG